MKESLVIGCWGKITKTLTRHREYCHQMCACCLCWQNAWFTCLFYLFFNFNLIFFFETNSIQFDSYLTTVVIKFKYSLCRVSVFVILPQQPITNDSFKLLFPFFYILLIFFLLCCCYFQSCFVLSHRQEEFSRAKTTKTTTTVLLHLKYFCWCIWLWWLIFFFFFTFKERHSNTHDSRFIFIP